MIQYLDNVNGWTTIDNDIDYSNALIKTTRVDDAFESGTVKAYLTRSTPIPPYTQFKIGDKGYVCSSEVTEYLSESNTYVHEISILETTAILKCFIVGVKVYSKESPQWSNDSAKITSLIKLMNQKYKSYTLVDNTLGVTTSRTYNFGATSTMYDCLNEIALENNKKVIAYFIADTTIRIEFVTPTENTSYSYTNDMVINKHWNQSTENYGKKLETYASNVVDTNTITHCDYMELKCDDIVLNADTAKLILPTPIEKIKEFGIRQTVVPITITVNHLDVYFPNGITASNNKYTSLLNKTAVVDGNTIYFFQDLFYREFIKYWAETDLYTWADAATWAYDSSFHYMTISVPASLNGKCPCTLDCLEKMQFDMLTPSEQCRKLFYTKGSNTIENFNMSYNYDLWHVLLGNAGKPFIEHVHGDGYGYDIYSGGVRAAYTIRTLDDADMFKYTYYVDYYAITNPYLIDDKTEQPINEAQWRDFGRSYGNSSNYIDFDKITQNMAISNNNLGRVEGVIELDVTEVENEPKAGQQISVNNITWYISNCIITQRVTSKVATISLVRNYTKKADSIGVDSQSETTNNPLHDIVTRPIYLEINQDQFTIDEIASATLYLGFIFYDHNGNIIYNTYNAQTWSKLYSRCSVQAIEDTVVLYCSMLDQMIFDYGRGAAHTGYWELVPFRYTDTNAECKRVQISVCVASQDNYTGEFSLPQGTNANIEAVLGGGGATLIDIDKDARETLTFTIKIKYN